MSDFLAKATGRVKPLLLAKHVSLSATVSSMTAGRSSPPELSAYLGHLIEEAMRNGATATEIARKAGISVAHVSTIRTGQRGVGWKSVIGLGRVFGKSLAEIEAEAAEWVRTNRPPRLESRVEADERYPERAKAVQAARLLGYSEEAIAIVESMALKGEDLPATEWLEFIKSRDRELELGLPARFPGVPVDPDDEPKPLPPPPRKPTGKK